MNAQLPEQHRATSCDLPAPVEVVWQLAVNTLDTRVQLSRELFGSRSRSEVFLSRGISKRELAASMCDVDEEAYPLGETGPIHAVLTLPICAQVGLSLVLVRTGC